MVVFSLCRNTGKENELENGNQFYKKRIEQPAFEWKTNQNGDGRLIIESWRLGNPRSKEVGYSKGKS